MCDCKEGCKGHRHVYCDICGCKLVGLILDDNQSGAFVCSDCDRRLEGKE